MKYILATLLFILALCSEQALGYCEPYPSCTEWEDPPAGTTTDKPKKPPTKFSEAVQEEVVKQMVAADIYQELTGPTDIFRIYSLACKNGTIWVNGIDSGMIMRHFCSGGETFYLQCNSKDEMEVVRIPRPCR